MKIFYKRKLDICPYYTFEIVDSNNPIPSKSSIIVIFDKYFVHWTEPPEKDMLARISLLSSEEEFDKIKEAAPKKKEAGLMKSTLMLFGLHPPASEKNYFYTSIDLVKGEDPLSVTAPSVFIHNSYVLGFLSGGALCFDSSVPTKIRRNIERRIINTLKSCQGEV
ncbi:MAG: hypothetical protein N3A54_06265 [Patescibacteria group bacterium]|nr:hypothetical protein [Patescibacteria group bacterium]